MPLLWSYQDAPLPFPVLFVLFTVVWLLWALLCHIPGLSALTLSPHHLLQIFLTRSVVFLSYSFYRLKLFARCLPPQKWPFKKKMWEGHCSVCSLLGSLGAMLEKTLESPLDCKEIQPVHPKGDQSWVFTGRTDAEAETSVLWPLHVKSWLIGKDPDARRDWGQKEKGTTEDEMAGWHHWLDGHEFE